MPGREEGTETFIGMGTLFKKEVFDKAIKEVPEKLFEEQWKKTISPLPETGGLFPAREPTYSKNPNPLLNESKTSWSEEPKKPPLEKESQEIKDSS